MEYSKVTVEVRESLDEETEHCESRMDATYGRKDLGVNIAMCILDHGRPYQILAEAIMQLDSCHGVVMEAAENALVKAAREYLEKLDVLRPE